jgi:uncharacterized repeat protein (TIGR03943 family)
MNAILKELKELNFNRTDYCRLMGIGAMMIWAYVLISFYVTGRVDAYIRPEYMRVGSLLAGLGLLALSIFNLTHLKSGEAASCCGHDHDHADGHDHDHDHGHDHSHEDTSFAGNASLLAVMLIPMIAAVTYSQDKFISVATILNKGSAQDAASVASRVEETLPPPAATTGEEKFSYSLADLEKVVDRSPEGNIMLTVDQIFYTAGDTELQRVLAGQSVEAVGQIIPDTDSKAKNRLKIFILMVSCCAADAQPVTVTIEFPGALPEHKEMQWVKVSGTMVYPVENGQKQAVLKVKKMEPTKEPANDLLY